MFVQEGLKPVPFLGLAPVQEQMAALAPVGAPALLLLWEAQMQVLVREVEVERYHSVLAEKGMDWLSGRSVQTLAGHLRWHLPLVAPSLSYMVLAFHRRKALESSYRGLDELCGAAKRTMRAQVVVRDQECRIWVRGSCLDEMRRMTKMYLT